MNVIIIIVIRPFLHTFYYNINRYTSVILSLIIVLLQLLRQVTIVFHIYKQMYYHYHCINKRHFDTNEIMD